MLISVKMWTLKSAVQQGGKKKTKKTNKQKKQWQNGTWEQNQSVVDKGRDTWGLTRDILKYYSSVDYKRKK